VPVGVVLRLLIHWHGLREDENIDGSKPRGVSGATQALNHRVSQAGLQAGLERSGSRTKATNGSRGGSSHENPDYIPVVPDIAPKLSIYGDSGGAGRALAGVLASTRSKPSRLRNGCRSLTAAMQITMKEGSRNAESVQRVPSTSFRMIVPCRRQSGNLRCSGEWQRERSRATASQQGFRSLGQTVRVSCQNQSNRHWNKPRQSDVRAKDRTQAATAGVKRSINEL